MTWSDYGYWTDFLNGRPKRKVANNTYARLEPDGRIVILYHSTDILTFFPNDEVEYQSGGWLTYTTKDRFNRFGAHRVRIGQTKGRWFVYAQGNWDATLTDYYDGMRVRFNGETVEMVTEARHSGDPDKKIKRDIDRYVALYTDERIAELVAVARRQAEEGSASGDCWYCQMRVVGTGVPMGEHTGDHSHLLDHIEEGYTMVSTALNAVAAAGYRNPPVILMMGDGKLTRRCLKHYLRQRLATNTAGAAGGPKPIASGF